MKTLLVAAALTLPATIVVNLPPEAALTINGGTTASLGPRRVFATPPLEEGKEFHYELEMTVGGETCVQEVAVRAGEETEVTLVMPDSPRTGEHYGVDKDKVPPGQLTLNGVPITRRQAMLLIGDGLPDDAQHPWITIIGPDAERKAILADLDTNPALAPYKGRWRVQEYTPEQWPLQGVGFVTEGKPVVIYLQASAGQVLHRQDCYKGPEQLALALRKADPAYDPKKDPDLTKPSSPSDALAAVPPIAWGGLAGILGILFLGKRKN